MNLQQIAAIAERELKNRTTHPWKDMGNKYYHGLRVAKRAVELRRQIVPEDDSRDEILTEAGWFHDLENGKENHAVLGAESTRRLLTGLCPPDALDEICALIEVHDRRRVGSDDPVWLKLQQDADLIDHFGTYDILVSCSYAMLHGQTAGQLAHYLRHERAAEYAGNRALLHFDVTRRMFDEKAAYVAAFARRLEEEVCLCE